MWQTVLKVLAFFKSIIEEEAGVGSASRVIGLIVTLTCTTVLLMSVHYQHNLPTSEQLTGLATFLGVGIGAYVGNQVKSAITAKSTSA